MYLTFWLVTEGADSFFLRQGQKLPLYVNDVLKEVQLLKRQHCCYCAAACCTIVPTNLVNAYKCISELHYWPQRIVSNSLL